MNLSTAVLIGERFMEAVVEQNLSQKIQTLIDGLKKAIPSSESQEQVTPHDPEGLATTAADILDIADNSVISDAALKVFPEYKRFGLHRMIDENTRSLLEQLIATEPMGNNAIEMAIATLTSEQTLIEDLSNEVPKLLSVADFFGVHKREPFEAKAIAVVQMPDGGETDAGSDASNVDLFIDRMQKFRGIISFCENGARTDPDADIDQNHNIRMISGDVPLVVADLSLEAANKLDRMVTEARHVRSSIGVIEEARFKLEEVGVNPTILDSLNDETKLFRGFGRMASDFLKDFVTDKENLALNEALARGHAGDILDLLDERVRVDSVVLDQTDASAPDAPTPMAETSTTNDNEAPAATACSETDGIDTSDTEADQAETVPTSEEVSIKTQEGDPSLPEDRDGPAEVVASAGMFPDDDTSNTKPGAEPEQTTKNGMPQGAIDPQTGREAIDKRDAISNAEEGDAQTISLIEKQPPEQIAKSKTGDEASKTPKMRSIWDILTKH